MGYLLGYRLLRYGIRYGSTIFMGVFRMSKGLEALEKIKQARYFVDFELDAKVGEDYKEEISLIETSLKVLEIIKDKKVDTVWLIRSEDCSQYNLGVGGFHKALEKKEYVLLKKVLK